MAVLLLSTAVLSNHCQRHSAWDIEYPVRACLESCVLSKLSVLKLSPSSEVVLGLYLLSWVCIKTLAVWKLAPFARVRVVMEYLVLNHPWSHFFGLLIWLHVPYTRHSLIWLLVKLVQRIRWSWICIRCVNTSTAVIILSIGQWNRALQHQVSRFT